MIANRLLGVLLSIAFAGCSVTPPERQETPCRTGEFPVSNPSIERECEAQLSLDPEKSGSLAGKCSFKGQDWYICVPESLCLNKDVVIEDRNLKCTVREEMAKPEMSIGQEAVSLIAPLIDETQSCDNLASALVVAHPNHSVTEVYDHLKNAIECVEVEVGTEAEADAYEDKPKSIVVRVKADPEAPAVERLDLVVSSGGDDAVGLEGRQREISEQARFVETGVGLCNKDVSPVLWKEHAKLAAETDALVKIAKRLYPTVVVATSSTESNEFIGSDYVLRLAGVLSGYDSQLTAYDDASCLASVEIGVDRSRAEREARRAFNQPH